MLTLARLVNWPSVICMNGQIVCYIKLVHTLLLEANHLSDPSKKTSFQQHQQKRERKCLFREQHWTTTHVGFTIEVCRSASVGLVPPWENSPFWLLVFTQLASLLWRKVPEEINQVIITSPYANRRLGHVIIADWG